MLLPNSLDTDRRSMAEHLSRNQLYLNIMSAPDLAASNLSVCLWRLIEAEDSGSYGNLESEPGEVIFTAG